VSIRTAFADRKAPALGASGIPVDLDWLATTREEVIDPGLPIVDAHTHLVDSYYARYLFDDAQSDIDAGHNIVATVFVESGAMHRPSGPVSLRPVGETEFAIGMAARSASGQYGKARQCAAIVGRADLMLDDNLDEVLDLHRQRAGSRLRGIRHTAAWDESADVRNPHIQSRSGIWREPAFQRGVKRLGRLGLSYEAWGYHPQLPELAALAHAVPDTRIVVDHLGGPIGIGPYASRREEAFRQWRAGLRELAACDNVFVKLGGMGMRLSGLGFHMREIAPTSSAVADALAPFITEAIELFGVGRSMFESNFPPDKGSYSYVVIWNAFKRLAAHASDAERDRLFAGTATDFYDLQKIEDF